MSVAALLYSPYVVWAVGAMQCIYGMTDMHRPIIGFYGSGLEHVCISRSLLNMNIIVEVWKHVTTKWRFDEVTRVKV